MAFEDIGKEVGMNMDAYRGNPGELEQQVNKSAQMGQSGGEKKSGLQAPLIKLLALQQLKQEQKTKEDQIKLQMMQQGQAPSVKDQVENDAIQRSVDETTKGIMGALNQQAAAKKKAQDRLLANATKFRPPTNPMAMMNNGIAGNRRNNMRSMAQGGIVGYNKGYTTSDERAKKNREKMGKRIFTTDMSTSRNNFPGSRLNHTEFPMYQNRDAIGFGPLKEGISNLLPEGLKDELSRQAGQVKQGAKNVQNFVSNISIPYQSAVTGEGAGVTSPKFETKQFKPFARFDTAPKNQILTETSGTPPNFDNRPPFDTRRLPIPEVSPDKNPNLLTSTKQPIKRPNIPPFVSDDGSDKLVNMPKSPTNVGPGGLQGLFDQRMKDAMADQYQGHEWMQPGGMMDFFKGLASGQLTGPADAMRAGEEQAYNRAFKRASAGMDFAAADAKNATALTVARINASTRNALRGQLTEFQRLNLLQNAKKEKADLPAKLIQAPFLGGDQQIYDYFTNVFSKATGEDRAAKQAELTRMIETHPYYSSLENDINLLEGKGNPSLFDKNQQDKTVVQKTP